MRLNKLDIEIVPGFQFYKIDSNGNHFVNEGQNLVLNQIDIYFCPDLNEKPNSVVNLDV